jgi:hypothetical protein
VIRSLECPSQHDLWSFHLNVLPTYSFGIRTRAAPSTSLMDSTDLLIQDSDLILCCRRNSNHFPLCCASTIPSIRNALILPLHQPGGHLGRATAWKRQRPQVGAGRMIRLVDKEWKIDTHFRRSLKVAQGVTFETS